MYSSWRSDLVGTFGVGGGAAFHDFVEPYEVGLLHGGFQLVAGLEVDVHRLHVAGREGFFCVGSLGAECDVKGSPVAQLSLLQLCLLCLRRFESFPHHHLINYTEALSIMCGFFFIKIKVVKK